MNIYQKTILQLLANQNIPGASEIVKKAIMNLQAQESEELKPSVIKKKNQFSFACTSIRVLI